MLVKRLAMLGKTSLYDQLGLTARVDDATLSATIARLQQEEAGGRVLGAELRYAIQTLADPAVRSQYDQSLFDLVIRAERGDDAAAASVEPPAHRSPAMIAALVAILAVVAYAALGFYQEKSRKEAAAAAITLQEKALQLEAEARAAKAEAERVAAVEATERAAQLTLQQQSLQQQHQSDQAYIRASQIELQREQLEERKKQATKTREQADRQREARAEQDKTRRAVWEAERENCLAGRRNNNQGEILRWCR